MDGENSRICAPMARAWCHASNPSKSKHVLLYLNIRGPASVD